MKYNVFLELPAVLFLLITYLGVRLRYIGSGERSRRYRRFLLLVTAAVLFDALAGLAITGGSSVPVLLQHALMQGYYLAMIWCGYNAAHYVYSCAGLRLRALVIIDRILAFAFMIFVITGPFTGFCYGTAGGRIDYLGTLYGVNYGLSAYFGVCILLVMLFCRRKFTDTQIGTNFIYVGSVLFFSMLQVLFFPQVRLSTLGLAVAVFVMLYSLETPDFGNLSAQHGRMQHTVAAQERKIENLSQQTIRTLAQVIDARDEPGTGHSSRVAAYSVLLAKELGWDTKRVEALRYAALLHDIGNIDVPEDVLKKHDRLTEEETARVRSHTIIGSEILKNIPSLPDAQYVARYHHECYDGSGYPEGLAGEKIPVAARIVAVAHAYDAMASERPYRTALPEDLIREELQRGRGTQFDPKLTDLILKLMENGALRAAEQEATRAEQESGIQRASIMLLNRLTEGANNTADNEKDDLTGLYIRKVGERRLEEAMTVSAGCLVFFDMDNLKRINDTLGHRFGDRIIAELGSVLRKTRNVAARIGGDEFMLFLPNVTREAAENRVRQMLSEFEKNKEPIFDSVTVSAGLCMTVAGMPFSEASMCADKALYHIKQNGKGDLYVYQDETAVSAQASRDSLLTVTKSLLLSGDYSGAMNLEIREFSQMYAFLRHMHVRYATPLQFLMLTIHPAPKMSENELEASMKEFEKAISASVRATDIVTRYGSNQFLVMFTKVDDLNVQGVIDRMLEKRSQMGREDAPEISWAYQMVE